MPDLCTEKYYIDPSYHVYDISNLTWILMWIWQPKFGGKIIDIVSGDTQTAEQKSKALTAVYSTIFEMFMIVLIGYECLTLLL